MPFSCILKSLSNNQELFSFHRHFKIIPYILCLLQQTHLLNPSLIELGLRFYIATASWLNQLALAGDSFDEMASFKEVEIPLPSEVYKFIVFCYVFQKKNLYPPQGRSFGSILLRWFPSKRSHHRFPMKLAMFMLQDKEILKT